jgi:hypothetical protein
VVSIVGEKPQGIMGTKHLDLTLSLRWNGSIFSLPRTCRWRHKEDFRFSPLPLAVVGPRDVKSNAQNRRATLHWLQPSWRNFRREFQNSAQIDLRPATRPLRSTYPATLTLGAVEHKSARSLANTPNVTSYILWFHWISPLVYAYFAHDRRCGLVVRVPGC